MSETQIEEFDLLKNNDEFYCMNAYDSFGLEIDYSLYKSWTSSRDFVIKFSVCEQNC